MGHDAAALKAALPVLARNEGVWDGTYRRYGADGGLLAAFQSRVVMRFRDDVPDEQMYHQTNLYRFADGKTQTIESRGWFDGEKLRFGSDRDIAGWAADDRTDSSGLICLLHMNVRTATPQLPQGTLCFELVQLSADGKNRARMAQYVCAGQVIMRTMIDEKLITADWRSQDWISDFLGTT
jgi:hypothetical protein